MAAALLLTVAPGAAGQESDAAGSDVGAAQEQLRESSHAMVAAAAALDAVREQLPAVQAELARARADLGRAQAREAELAEALARAQHEEARAVERLAAATRALARTQHSTDDMARNLYMRGGTGELGELGVAVGAETAEEFTGRLTLGDAVSRVQKAQLARLRAQRLEVAAETARLEAAREAAAAARTAAVAVVERQREVADRASRAQRRIDILVAQRTAALRAAQAAQRQDEARFAELASEAQRLQQQLALGLDAVSGPPQTLGGRGLTIPVGGRISSPYGMRRHPITGVTKLHSGTDFAVGCGTPIRAALGGTVTESFFQRAYGHRVVVDHGQVDGVRLTTTYNHLQSPGAATGSRVAAGGAVGRVGSTGYSTGCHLHFEVLRGGQFVDPLTYL